MRAAYARNASRTSVSNATDTGRDPDAEATVDRGGPPRRLTGTTGVPAAPEGTASRCSGGGGAASPARGVSRPTNPAPRVGLSVPASLPASEARPPLTGPPPQAAPRPRSPRR
ncbi:hypothetical protein GCM10027047_39570 [Rhodococcus aerolatus]